MVWINRPCFSFIFCGLAIYISLLSGAQVQPDAKGRTRLADKVNTAKKSGKQTLELHATSGIEPVVPNIAAALSSSTIIVGTPVAKQTYVEPATDIVSTWYQFQLFDQLSKRAVAPLAPNLDKLPEWALPNTLLPVGENEVLVTKGGGSIVIDGVTVNVTEANFPDPLMGHIYLIFISESNDTLAIFPFGAAGVYEVLGDELSSVGDKKHPVVAGIKNLYRNSLSTLKAGIVTKKP